MDAKQTFECASAMPAATWHFLKMNDTTITVPDGLAAKPAVKLSGACSTVDDDAANGTASFDAFEKALAEAQIAWEATHPAPTAEELAEREAYRIAEADATYGGTALSTYQAGADAAEESRSLATTFQHGIGEEAAAFLREAAGERVNVLAGQGETTDAQVIVEGVRGAVSAAAIDVVAAPNSTVNLSIVVDDAQPDDAAQGLTGTTVRVFAGENAQVNITRTQTLGDGFTDLDDMGLFADGRAHVQVSQTVLGASATYTGLAGDLRGDDARADVKTHYLGHDDQSHDFNYILRHHGQRTRCNLVANGVLAGESRKTLRGTIDLIRGCKGAEGSENETVLLVDEDVRNKTIPVILCNEDDVAGNHGATIGHIREEQLFYLASRGLSQKVAESMFVGAALERAAIEAPDQAARDGVVNLGNQVVPGFADLFGD